VRALFGPTPGQGRDRRREAGLTLVELLVAFAIAMVLLVGGVEMLRFMVLTTRANGDETLAALQVDYAGFWISQDALQAANVTLGNATWTCGEQSIAITGLGNLTLKWEGECGEGAGAIEGNNTVVYQLLPDEANLDADGCPLARLTRTHGFYDSQGVLAPSCSQGNSTVGEHLVPESTRCTPRVVGNRTTVLLEVAALVSRSGANAVATNTYEIHPRAGNVTWRQVPQ